MMINLIQTEFSKLKRQKTIFTIMGVLLLFWVGMMVNVSHRSTQESIGLSI